MEFGGETAMNAEKLLIHDCGEGEVTERLHAGVVYRLRVLVLAWETKDSYQLQRPPRILIVGR